MLYYPVSFPSKKEFVNCLINGHVLFTRNLDIIYFNNDVTEDNPFRIDKRSGEECPLTDFSIHGELFTQQKSWYLTLTTQKVLCWVGDVEDKERGFERVAVIESYNPQSGTPFIDTRGISWLYAVPVGRNDLIQVYQHDELPDVIFPLISSTLDLEPNRIREEEGR